MIFLFLFCKTLFSLRISFIILGGTLFPNLLYHPKKLPNLKELDFSHSNIINLEIIFKIFEFEIALNRITFRAIISPGDEEVRAILVEIMENVKGAKTPKGKKWIAHFIEGFRFEFGEMSDEEIENFFDKIFSDKFSEIINNVDEEMLKRGQELQKLQ